VQLAIAVGAAAAPAVPQNSDAVIEALETVLTQACQTAYLRGRQLSNGWQQQVIAAGPAEYTKSLSAFRDASAICLQQLGTGIDGASRNFPDITSAIAGSWTFAPALWIATNNFALAIASDPSSPVPDHIAKAESQSQQFAAAIGQFSTWINDTESRLMLCGTHRVARPNRPTRVAILQSPAPHSPLLVAFSFTWPQHKGYT